MPFLGLLVSCNGRLAPVITVGGSTCCILARSLCVSRSQMFTANRSPGTQNFRFLILLVLTVGLFLAGCAALTSTNGTPKGNGAAGAPTITAQPISADVTAGQTASFSVAVTGTAPFNYQWQKNGTAISSATSSTYTTPPTTASDNRALFAVVVSNSAGSTTSTKATLNVAAATGDSSADKPK